MVVSQTEKGTLRIDPYVYVRDTGTLYYETACGSGSTALGLSLSITEGQSISNLEILQPSGLPLIVTVERNETAFKRAYVSGPVEVLYDARLYTPRQTINRTPERAMAL